MPQPGDTVLLTRLLDDQHDLSAVEQFAQRHERGEVPLQAKYYRDLIPAAAPGDGEQYRFDVDLDACTGCKGCVAACHQLNGLEDDEAWREVGLITGGTAELPVLQTVTSACHHCLAPACMDGCPTGAYEKDSVTGIVHHLDDQCIGCQYCLLTCPYGAPKYSKSRGIVRKCDMCSDRLSVGEAPACVQACPNQAIRITTVDVAEAIEDAEADAFLPGAPDSGTTLPTTVYRTNKVLPRNTRAADHYELQVEHAHMPLVVMLVLTQMSVGAFLVQILLHTVIAGPTMAVQRPFHAISALTLGALALAASVLHLGRPHLALRSVIGLRTSWLSREIASFGLFAVLAAVYATCTWLLGSNSTQWVGLERFESLLGNAVVASGLLGVGCSVMVYHVTGRRLWSGPSTAVKFLLTTLMLGLSTATFTSLLTAGWLDGLTAREVMGTWGYCLCALLMVVVTLKLLLELSVFRHLRERRHTPRKRTAMLLAGALSSVMLKRVTFGVLGGIAIPGLLLADRLLGEADDFSAVFVGALAVVMLTLTLAGELTERYLFFRAVVSNRMPGGIA